MKSTTKKKKKKTFQCACTRTYFVTFSFWIFKLENWMHCDGWEHENNFRFKGRSKGWTVLYKKQNLCKISVGAYPWNKLYILNVDYFCGLPPFSIKGCCVFWAAFLLCTPKSWSKYIFWVFFWLFSSFRTFFIFFI